MKYTKTTVISIAILLLTGAGLIIYRHKQTQARQDYIHDRGVMVMPFDLDKTTHFFTKTKEGGVQKILVKDPQDSEQIDLIRTHLQKEAELFNKGDFSDPSALHGESMPGLSVLEQSADKVAVEYSDIPDGGQLTYITDDPEIINALHLWFMAQLQDHGMDAMEHK
jgi:hypothetical protein